MLRRGDLFEGLPTVALQQLVTWNEAAMNWRRLCEALGEPAPGPAGSRLPPTPSAIRRAGTHRVRALGIGAAQAKALLAVARPAHALPTLATLSPADALYGLQSIPGVGPCTAHSVLGMRLGRPDVVPAGDHRLPSTVAWALAREPRGDDARMLELLEPSTGQRFRVVRLLLAGRIEAPRRGPRRAWPTDGRPGLPRRR